MKETIKNIISDIIEDFSNETQSALDKLEDTIQNAVSENEDYIDIENFIFELKKNNLYTKELEDFIEYYRRYKVSK